MFPANGHVYIRPTGQQPRLGLDQAPREGRRGPVPANGTKGPRVHYAIRQRQQTAYIFERFLFRIPRQPRHNHGLARRQIRLDAPDNVGEKLTLVDQDHVVVLPRDKCSKRMVFVCLVRTPRVRANLFSTPRVVGVIDNDALFSHTLPLAQFFEQGRRFSRVHAP